MNDLRSGMMLDQDVRNESGLLLIARGHEITLPLLIRLRSLVSELERSTASFVCSRGRVEAADGRELPDEHVRHQRQRLAAAEDLQRRGERLQRPRVC